MNMFIMGVLYAMSLVDPWNYDPEKAPVNKSVLIELKGGHYSIARKENDHYSGIKGVSYWTDSTRSRISDPVAWMEIPKSRSPKAISVAGTFTKEELEAQLERFEEEQ